MAAYVIIMQSSDSDSAGNIIASFTCAYCKLQCFARSFVWDDSAVIVVVDPHALPLLMTASCFFNHEVGMSLQADDFLSYYDPHRLFRPNRLLLAEIEVQTNAKNRTGFILSP
jgi:hypothetical protein